jgi:hypothetical protein
MSTMVMILPSKKTRSSFTNANTPPFGTKRVRVRLPCRRNPAGSQTRRCYAAPSKGESTDLLSWYLNIQTCYAGLVKPK